MPLVPTQDIGIFLGGGDNTQGGKPLEVDLDANAAVAVGPGALPVAAKLAIGGAEAVAANVIVQGAGAPVAARVTAAIDPVQAGVTADITQLPPINLRIPDVPPVNVTVPSEYTLGFSIFGFEIFSLVFASELKARTP